MWTSISELVLKNRIVILLLIVVSTVFMANEALDVKFSFDRAKILPSDHQVYLENLDFQEKYGLKHVMAVAVEDKDFFKLENFKFWDNITSEISKFDGVENIISINLISKLEKNDSLIKFDIKPWFDSTITTQYSLDSALKVLSFQKFYEGVFDRSKNGTIMLITLDNEIINSKSRDYTILGIKEIVDSYSEKYQASLFYSGMPYMRTINSINLKKEILLFILLTLFVTSSILFLFFRSIKITLISMIVVVIGAIWAFGTMSLFGYEITLLTALVPPVLIVIGIPNCIFLINKFHAEFKRNGDKNNALKIMISKIGNITFLTNITTASGFAAFTLTESQSLQEFGLVSSLNILGVFMFSLFIIPIMFSFFKTPNSKNIKHLDRRWINYVVDYLSFLIQNKRPAIYKFTILIFIIGVFGLLKVQITGNLSDDFNKKQDLYKDLKFFERNYGGVMPLEILVDTKKKNGLFKSYNLKKINELNDLLLSYKEFSKPSSYIDFLKYSKQAYYNNDTSYYSLPNSQEQRFLTPYLANTDSEMDVSNIYLDSLNQEARISLRIADVSTTKMDSIMSDLEPKISSLFDSKKYNVIITGTTKVLLTGTKFLLSNLFVSLFLVIILISIFMAWMFGSVRMVVLSLVPNLLPLLLTGAIMGFFGIALKPSTILVFSIAFGISVDDTIHFLAKYRQELMSNNWNVKESVLEALKETGVSMIYTSIVLFCGFFIFIASDFGGTVALGLLVSITLLIAMLSNLVLLPALLLTNEKHLVLKNNN